MLKRDSAKFKIKKNNNETYKKTGKCNFDNRDCRICSQYFNKKNINAEKEGRNKNKKGPLRGRFNSK